MKKYVVISIIVLLAFVAGRYSGPSEVKTIEVEKIVEVTKESSDKKEIGFIHENEIKRPDGTIETKRIKIYANQNLTKKEQNSSKVNTKVAETKTLPEHQIGVLYRLYSKTDKRDSYIFTYQKRIVSSIYFGGYVKPDSQLEYGLLLSVGF